MARKPRVHIEGGLYHVMLRGNAGLEIYSDNADREEFYRLLASGVTRYSHQVCAFCLMPNHVHLAVRVGPTPLSKIVQNVAFRYTRWFNWRRRRTGHLFQGRYKAILVDTASYLLQLVRYIHLNPVRAGLVTDPRRWPWSGHRSYLEGHGPPWLDTEWVLGMFSDDTATARRRYAGFVREGMGERFREEFHRSEGVTPPVSATGVRSSANAAVPPRVTLDEVVARVCSHYNLEQHTLCGAGRARQVSLARALVALLVMDAGCATLTAAAQRCGRDLSSMSLAAHRLRDQMNADQRLALDVEAVRSALGMQTTQA